ncbi:MAG: Mrp/NBP35 family ATP-binding protein [Nitrospirae bacterium]|nr:Mrp/NBP35 family ATP-binding protein [Nitrospirota bacterium]
MGGLDQAVLGALGKIQDPDLGRDIVSLGFIKNLAVNDGSVSFTIELTTPACPVKDRMKEEAERVVRAVPGVRDVRVAMTAQVRSIAGEKKERLCPGVKNVIPVASGKGGVGKSTVSANVALALSQQGASVGLMDADVYGPSIPTLLGCADQAPHVDRERIRPVEVHGLKTMSFAFFVKPEQAVVWRGPMLHRAIQQFLGDVEWGELDYLVVDLPPGTGDVQLSLCQSIPLTGAVVVSTPQDVALSIAQKAISMFEKLNCPILGLVENMSYFICGQCNHRHEIFGHGGARRACDRMGLPFLGEIPLTTELRIASDEGRPLLAGTNGSSPHAEAFVRVAQNLAAQVSIRAMKDENRAVSITF